MSRKGIAGADIASIKLVEIRPKHFAHVIRWRNDPDNSRYFFTKGALNLKAQREWYRRYRQDPTDLTFIILAAPDTPIGLLALYHIDDAHRTAEFGRLLIGETLYRRRRFAYDACRACLSIAFAKLHLEEVYLEVYESNHAAIWLYERLGFVVDRGVKTPAPDMPAIRMCMPASHFVNTADVSFGVS